MSTAPKRIKDIRYFESVGVPGPGRPLPSNGALFDLPPQAQRLGQRIACILESESFSAGTYDHVYITFTPALPEGCIELTDFGFESWNRYIAYGTGRDFKLLPEDRKLRYIEAATFAALKALKPQGSHLLDSVRSRLAAAGSRARVLRAMRETEKYRFEVWFDVPPLHEKAYVYITAFDKISGKTLEAAPLPIADYEHVFPLVSTVTFSKGIVKLNPRRSFRAQLATSGYEAPIGVPISSFSAQMAANDV